MTGEPWRIEWPVLAGAAVALVLFGQAVVRLRRRGRADLAGADRGALYALGVGVATLALVSPLDSIGEQHLLSAHMLQHVLIGDAAPALVLVALRGPLVFFLLPPAALRSLARLRGVLGVVLRPRVSFLLWASAYGAWHVPALYDYVLTRPAVHDLEHLSFMVGGLLVWAQLVDPAGRGALSRPRRIGYAFALFVCGQALADVLIFSFTTLYPAYTGWHGLSALRDQQLAGLVMMAEQLLTLGICVALLATPYLRRHGQTVRLESLAD